MPPPSMSNNAGARSAFGSGLPLLGDLPDALRLELIEAQTVDTGTVLHVYEPRDRAGRPPRMSVNRVPATRRRGHDAEPIFVIRRRGASEAKLADAASFRPSAPRYGED